MLNGKRVKVFVAPDETCWAELLDSPNVELLNIPYSDEYNAHDVVEADVVEDDGSARVVVVRLVERRFRNKTCVEYGEPFIENFRSICEAVGSALEGDHALEGIVEGRMLVAHNGADVASIVAPVGRLARVQPRLHRGDR